MNDYSIRKLLRANTLNKYYNDDSSVVFEEMKLPSTGARIDMAVVNGCFHGYEIKSARDTLQRLPNQINSYTKIFDYLTVVTEEKYHKRILDNIPEWIGLDVCSVKDNQEIIECVRNPIRNYLQESFFVAKLLKQSELIEVFKELGIYCKKNERIWTLCEILSNTTSIDIISYKVREQIKKRL